MDIRRESDVHMCMYVCVTHKDGGMRSVEMPSELATQIEVAPAALLA